MKCAEMMEGSEVSYKLIVLSSTRVTRKKRNTRAGWGFSGSSILYDSSAETEIEFDESISGSSIDVEATAHCWHITEDQNNDPVNIRIPAPPEGLRAAYSVHVRNNLYTSVVESTAKPDISIYPNPATNHLIIDYSNGFGEVRVEIHNLLGSRVSQFNISTTGTHVIDCSKWTAGLYSLSISANDFTNSYRFTVVN
jgi:hypothetical protein